MSSLNCYLTNKLMTAILRTSKEEFMLMSQFFFQTCSNWERWKGEKSLFLKFPLSITSTCWRISILRTRRLNLQFVSMLVPHSYINQLATLLLMTLTLLITLFCDFCHQKTRNGISLNQSIGNTTSKDWWIQ